jgi:SAM-dependent methyltransferase
MRVNFDTKIMPPPQHNCRVCGNAKNAAWCWVDAEATDRKLSPLYAYKCVDCGSIYYDGSDPVLGYQDEGFSDGYWRHYAQVGAGITAMLEPLFALESAPDTSLLDVGCGFGYVVDFWNKAHRGSAVGLEMASYGKIGKEKLGAPILPAYLQDAETIRESAFDIVYASEVLEHITSPKEFIAEVSSKLSAKGVLVLTTPSADAVSIENGESSVIAALSPYFHYFILSEGSLMTLLKGAGFKDVKVHNANGRLFAWASKKALPGITIGKIDWTSYFNYLSLLGQNQDHDVACGALYRLFKDALNTGNMPVASTAFRELETKAEKVYGLSFQYPDTQRYLQRKDPVSGLETNPAWYGCSLLFGGILVGHLYDDRRRKLRLLDAAEQVLKHEASSTQFRQFAQEAEYFAPYAKGQLTVATAEFLDQQLRRPELDSLISDTASLKSALRSVCAFAATKFSPCSVRELAGRLVRQMQKTIKRM